MNPHKRLFIMGGALVLFALIITVLVWLLLQDVFVRQETQKVEADTVLETPSTAIGQ